MTWETGGLLPPNFASGKTIRKMNDYDTILESIDAHMGAISKQVEALKVLRLDSKTCIDVLYTRKEAADYIGRSLRQSDHLCAEGRIRRTITRDGLRFRINTSL